MNTLTNSKILVNGANGLIGSNLTEYPVEKGCSIIAFGRYNSNYDKWLEYQDLILHSILF